MCAHNYPVFIDLHKRRVLVAGGGQVACRKVLKLLEAGAEIVIVSPDLCPDLSELSNRKEEITWLQKEIQVSDIPDDIWLVVAATSNPDVQQMLYQEAERRKIFSNIVDQPDISSFIVPSTFRCGALELAISTGGISPAVAKLARLELEKQFDTKWAILLDIVGIFRKAVLTSSLPSDRKRKICAAMGNPKLLEWIEGNRLDIISGWMSEISGNEIEKELCPVKDYILSVYGTDMRKAKL